MHFEGGAPGFSMSGVRFCIMGCEFFFPLERLANMAGFNGLTFAVVPVVTGAGALNTAGLPAATVVAGFVDPTTSQRLFNPVAEGNAVAGGDTYTKWLPTISAAGISATQITDNYWNSIPATGGIAPKTSVGQVTLPLTPTASNVVEASSVMTFKLSPQALVITCTAGTF